MKLNFIRDQRQLHQMTMRQLADKLGVSITTIYNYEAQKSQPSAIHIVKLLEIFGCSIDDLLYLYPDVQFQCDPDQINMFSSSH